MKPSADVSEFPQQNTPSNAVKNAAKHEPLDTLAKIDDDYKETQVISEDFTENTKPIQDSTENRSPSWPAAV